MTDPTQHPLTEIDLRLQRRAHAHVSAAKTALGAAHEALLAVHDDAREIETEWAQVLADVVGGLVEEVEATAYGVVWDTVKWLRWSVSQAEHGLCSCIDCSTTSRIRLANQARQAAGGDPYALGPLDEPCPVGGGA